MQNIEKMRTVVKAFQGGYITVKYGMSKLGDQNPYFSITGDLKSGVHNVSGCIHNEIEKHCPNLVELIKWHLVDQNGVPMRYLVNTVYWRSQFGKEEKAFDYVKKTMIFGVVEGDLEYYITELSERKFKEWLESRLPELQKAFHDCMIAFNVEYIT